MSVTTTAVAFGHGASLESNPAVALEQLDQQLDFGACDAVILFVSADYDLTLLQQEIACRIRVPLLCCTTAGEISSENGYSSSGIAAATVRGCRASLISLPDLSKGELSMTDPVALACEQVAHFKDEPTTIGLVVVDGLCRREESVVEILQSAMPTVAIVGGSAGDSCKFSKTLVFIDGQFRSDTGALLLLSGDFTAIPFQTHHFTSSGTRVVATEVDAPNRRVISLDGVPATTRLAEIVGCSAEALTTERLATKPLMLHVGDAFFVRSVAGILPDGSISLLCAINEGEILHIGKAGEIVDITAAYFDALSHQNSTPDLVLGFDCILRRLELKLKGTTNEINRVIASVPFIGFSTFGEQLDGQHINQTMTGVALWKR